MASTTIHRPLAPCTALAVLRKEEGQVLETNTFIILKRGYNERVGAEVEGTISLPPHSPPHTIPHVFSPLMFPVPPRHDPTENLCLGGGGSRQVSLVPEFLVLGVKTCCMRRKNYSPANASAKLSTCGCLLP